MSLPPAAGAAWAKAEEMNKGVSNRGKEEERRPLRAHRAIDDLGHLELRVDLDRDTSELALALEQRDPVAQVECDAHVP